MTRFSVLNKWQLQKWYTTAFAENNEVLSLIFQENASELAADYQEISPNGRQWSLERYLRLCLHGGEISARGPV
jgi:hypothetical protein